MTAFFGLRNTKRMTFMVYVLSILFLAYRVDRTDFISLFLAFALAFAAYAFWIIKRTYKKKSSILRDAILIRLLIVLCLPQLSDDYHRFVWDGEIQTQSINPYTALPSQLIDRMEALEPSYQEMNSQEYYSVYPPLMQWVFHLSALSPGVNPWMSVLIMRFLLILADIGILFLSFRILALLKMPISNAALYALNPLVIIELTGNLHFEGLMIFFTLGALYALMRSTSIKNRALAALSFAFGVVTKLSNLLLLPALLRKEGMAKATSFYLISSLAVLLAFLPFISEVLVSNITSSLDLYFRNFQFNSSVYALTVKCVSFWIPHYTAQAVGPVLFCVSALSIILISLIRKSESWGEYLITVLFVYLTYLLFTSTVHPWYVANLLALGMFTRFRFPFLWSFMIVLSYHMYANDLKEVWWVIALEYIVVLGYTVYEVLPQYQRSKG